MKREVTRLKTENTRLRKREKLRADLTHMIIHDLKTPLAEVIANLSLLEEEALSPPQHEYLGSAILGAEELIRRVQNILEILRLETNGKMIRPSFFDPLETIQRVINGFAVLSAMKGIPIRVHSSDGSHSLYADQDLFARIVLNLLVNAIEHTPSGGEIDVDLSWSKDSKNLQIGVVDGGPGIKKKDRNRVFEKFYTVRHGGASGHLGLGLHFCKLAVEAHGGRIWIEDGPGAGSRFLFYIPNGPGMGRIKRRPRRSDGPGR